MSIPRWSHAGSLLWTLLMAGLIGVARPSLAADFSAEGRQARQELRDRIMPYWYDTAIDWTQGGYRLCDDARTGRCEPPEKQLVTQARMIWGFSLAHRQGWSTAGRDYRKAAAHGLRFLRERMKDPVHGGYFWSTTLDGSPRDTRKRLYGEAFVIYGLVEFFRATQDRSALDDAMTLFQEIQRRAHDAQHGGWKEHFERDWTPLPLRHPEAIVEVAGLKSANTHLHLMEAFSELYDVSRDPQVRAALEESLRLNRQYFYPADPARSAFHCHPDWSPVTDPSSAGLSYGHNVEFAWLMLRAEDVLGQPRSWKHFNNHVAHALKYGTDPVRGGVYNRGHGNEPATDRDKVWWVQSEMLAALAHGLAHSPEHPEYRDALAKLWLWIHSAQADPKTGIWLDTVRADGTPKSTALAHNWKAAYHDVRALHLFAEAFAR